MLPRCLNSVKEADEIIVVDTGSDDDTCKIVREMKLPNLILSEGEYKWNDHFAEARNFVKNKTSGDWVLSIDADNYLEEGGIEKIRSYIEKAEKEKADSVEYTVLSVPYNHTHKLPWIFKKSCNWKYRVHNVLEHKKRITSGITVYAEYSPAHKKDPDRALRILKKQLEEYPGDPRTLYYLAREYYYRKEYDTAIDMFKQCVDRSFFDAEKADACLYIAKMLWWTKKGPQARTYCLKAMGINPHFKEAFLLMADMSWPENAVVWKKAAEACDNRNVLFVRV